MRTLRTLGLALVAMLAMSALAASASADEFTAEENGITLTGGKDPGVSDVLVTTAGNTTCDTPKYTATGIVSGVTQITVTPSYSGCKSGGFPATVDVNNCDYLLKINGGTSTTGTVDIVCPAGQEITVTANPSDHKDAGGKALTPKCITHFGPQAGIGTVTYSNVSNANNETREVTLSFNLKNIHYKHTPGTGLGACTTGTATSGALSGGAMITGENAAGTTHRGIFLTAV